MSSYPDAEARYVAKDAQLGRFVERLHVAERQRDALIEILVQLCEAAPTSFSVCSRMALLNLEVDE